MDSNSDAEVIRLMSTYERAPCGHQGDEKSAEECLRDVFAAPRYCLAGRCKWTMKLAYHYPHVLVLMWDPQNVLVLRAPSESSRDSAERSMEGKRLHAGDIEREMTKQARLEERRERAAKNKDLSKKIAYNMRFHHKPIAKGPNPLSVLKKMNPEERSRPRQPNSPFRQFGGDASEEARDPTFVSRSKMRRKRKRLEMSLNSTLPSSYSSQIHSSEPTASVTDKEKKSSATKSAPPSEHPSEALSQPEKKIRKRRRPRGRTDESDANKNHEIRAGERERDAALEQAITST